jgi:hypothetical protein
MKNGRVVDVSGVGRSLYIAHADRVEKEMRLFLENIS